MLIKILFGDTNIIDNHHRWIKFYKYFLQINFLSTIFIFILAYNYNLKNLSHIIIWDFIILFIEYCGYISWRDPIKGKKAAQKTIYKLKNEKYNYLIKYIFHPNGITGIILIGFASIVIILGYPDYVTTYIYIAHHLLFYTLPTIYLIAASFYIFSKEQEKE